MSKTAHDALPQPVEPITTPLVEALHYIRGAHYLMIRQMEMQIPIPSLPGKIRRYYCEKGTTVCYALMLGRI